jgi:hypothetical protein
MTKMRFATRLKDHLTDPRLGQRAGQVRSPCLTLDECAQKLNTTWHHMVGEMTRDPDHVRPVLITGCRKRAYYHFDQVQEWWDKRLALRTHA